MELELEKSGTAMHFFCWTAAEVSLELSEIKYCMEDKNQGMFLTIWEGKIATDSGWEKQMVVNYENRALLLLQPLLQLPQPSSSHLTEGPLGSRRWVGLVCVLQASLENSCFSLSFVWHCFKVWNEQRSPYILRAPFPLSLCLSQCLSCGQPRWAQHGWMASCRRDPWSLQARVSLASSECCSWSPELPPSQAEAAIEDVPIEATLLALLGKTCGFHLQTQDVQQPCCKASGFGKPT